MSLSYIASDSGPGSPVSIRHPSSRARRASNLGETDLINLLRAQQQAFEAELSAELRRLEQQRAVARYNQGLGVVPL